MSKCLNCRVEILDETDRCPLCNSVLVQDGRAENMYPDLRSPTRRLALAARIYLFCAILLETVLVGINIYLDHQLWWCVLTGLALLYGYLLLRFAVLGRSGYQSKAVVLTILAVLSAVAADFVTGYRGWSVDYVLPGSILFIDCAILIMMLINRRNWQSYIIWQIMMTLCSLIPAGLYIKGLENNICLAFLPMAASGFIFLGTMIIGDRRAKLELKRRFHF